MGGFYFRGFVLYTTHVENGLKLCNICKKLTSVLDFYIAREGKRGKSIYVDRCKKCYSETTLVKNKLFKREKVKIPFSDSWFNVRFEKLRYSAMYRGKSFNLSLERFCELKSQKLCTYCNSLMNKVSIDRIINDKGYSDINCVAACIKCNGLKRNFTYKTILNMSNIMGKTMVQ